MDKEDLFIFMCSPEECDSFTTIDETVIVGESDVHHGADDDLSVPHHGPLEHAVHAEDGGLGRVDDGGSEQGAEHSTIAETNALDTNKVQNCNFAISQPNGESAPIHVLHRKFIVLCFLSQGGNSFLDICVGHVSNISQDRDHQALQTITVELV